MGALDDIDLVAAFPHPNPKERIQERIQEMKEGQARRAKAGVWKTGKGDSVPYQNLKSDHLVNILLQLRRSAKESAESEASTLGLRLGPDGWKACKPDAWDGLLHELRSRGGILVTAADLLEDNVFNEETIRDVFRKPDFKKGQRRRKNNQ